MKILIAADMEGIAGVVSWEQVDPDNKEYARFRKLMTDEVNAAVRGACEGGAETVMVADGHAFGRNILVEELDPRAQLHSGSPNPHGMVAGAAAGVDGAIFVGYHGRAGTENAILDHTWSSKLVTNLWLNDLLVGEIGLNAAMCGHFDVPVVMVSGDQAVGREATELLGNIETVAVKEATGRMAAHCLAPEVAQERIREAVSRAVGRLQEGDTPDPLRLSRPITLTIECPKSDMAEKAAVLPGAWREERRVSYSGDDMMETFRAMRSMLALAE